MTFNNKIIRINYINFYTIVLTLQDNIISIVPDGKFFDLTTTLARRLLV